MAKIDLSKYGITGSTVIAHNPSYEELFKEETKAGLTGYDKGQETELGAVNVMTGVFTGRSPKDKYIVDNDESHNNVWSGFFPSRTRTLAPAPSLPQTV